jgi:ABC-type lipoprotein export system ATPase subunit
MTISLSGISVCLPNQTEILFRIPKLEIPSGSRLLIQGPSGKGKTTLLHLIAGLFPPFEGTVQIGNRNLRYLTETELCQLRRNHFGLIFQKLNLIEHLTALENALLALLKFLEKNFLWLQKHVLFQTQNHAGLWLSQCPLYRFEQSTTCTKLIESQFSGISGEFMRRDE